MPPENPRTASWLTQAFASAFARSPVNATFVGVPGHDHELPDWSENGLGDAVAGIRAALAAVPRPPHQGRPGPRTGDVGSEGTSSDSFWSALDVRLMEGFLEIQDWEYGSGHFQRGNPSAYTGEAVFGFLGLFLTDFAPLAERVEWAVARMNEVPAFLEQARTNVRQAPTEWTDRAVRECRGGIRLLTDGVDQMIGELHIRGAAFKAASDRAARAFVEYDLHLRNEMKAREAYACGEEALSMYLARGHFLAHSPDQLAEYATEQLEAADRLVGRKAARMGATDPAAALAHLGDHHPSIDNYYAAYGVEWRRIRDLAKAKRLLSWPEFPIRYVPRPAWCRAAAPDLYFLYYRSPAAFRRPAVHDYLVLPIDETMPAEEQVALLRSNNDSVILLNHVAHHGGIGHHVQNWHAFRSRSRVGQVAAVDCASRINMFCGGTMAEGWACYATDLIREAGGLTNLQTLAEHQSRRRMCARAIVDVRLHQGTLSLDQAARFYQERAGMSPAAARGEAVKNSMFPGAAVMYLMGTDRIHSLRKQMERLKGNGFSLATFHDEFLSFGSVPVTLIAHEMERRHAAAE